MSGPALFLTGVLRGVGGVFAVIDDAGHRPFGVASVQTFPDRVRVHYTARVCQLAAIQATADESFVRAGIAVGVSGGLTYADVYFARAGVAVPPSQACLPWSNAWLTGWAWGVEDAPAQSALE